MKQVFATLVLVAAFFGKVGANDARPLDSVGVAVKSGNYFIIHEVMARQTLYAVSKIYKVTTQELLEANPGMIPALQGGQLMLVPLKNFTPPAGLKLSYIDENGKLQREGETAKKTEPKEEVTVPPKKEEKKPDPKTEPKKEEPKKEEIKPQPKAEEKFDWKKYDGKEDLYHTVQPGETLYKIATYYGLSVQEIMDLNNMENSVIAEGKSLLVKKAARKQEPKREDTPKKEETTTTPKETPAEAATNEISETGLGLVIDKNFPDAEKNIALHTSAQVGTIIKITNPANNREIYVRVVGKLKTDEKGVVIMISPEAANQLGASLTGKVKLNLSYSR